MKEIKFILFVILWITWMYIWYNAAEWEISYIAILIWIIIILLRGIISYYMYEKELEKGELLK